MKGSVTVKRMMATVLAAAAVLLAGTAGGEPRLTGFEVGPANVTVRGTGEAGIGYKLQWSPKLGADEDWQFAGAALAGTDGVFAATDGASGGAGFYRVAEGAEGDAPAYLVVDLSGGTNEIAWPVSSLERVPKGGWTDEYKTSKLVLRRIPAGTFTMGSPTNELGHYDDEVQHEVTISRPFYAGVFEVTQRQWELATGTRPSYFYEDSSYAARPVERVSYRDIRGAVAGANWPEDNLVDPESFLGVLRAKTGLEFDLPTEAQWQYACRAGTASALNSGKELTSLDSCPNVAEVARYKHNGGEGAGRESDASKGTAKVGSYKPNKWGLYDMHGNVGEWCLDWYGKYGTAARVDPKGSAEGENRMAPGLGWDCEARFCRSACRASIRPDMALSNVGFRLACPAQAQYLVVDMSGGPEAAHWPANERMAMPEGGWGDEYKSDKLVLRRIPAGTFTMGSPGEETGRDTGSGEDQHKATVPDPFYLGVFEVTQRQWERAMGTNPACFTNAACRATCPVENVSYDDIRGAEAGAWWQVDGVHTVDGGSFLHVLREKTGLEFDLPTETQWEYACRAGTATALNSGKNLTTETSCPNMDEVGRYRYNGGNNDSPACDTAGGTAKAGSYKPNAWGLYDMHGNVAEWTLDLYQEEETPGPSGFSRVVRSGAWYGAAGSCRSASRVGCGSSQADKGIGLRLWVPFAQPLQ